MLNAQQRELLAALPPAERHDVELFARNAEMAEGQLITITDPVETLVAKDFNPSQPRDADGRWTGGGALGALAALGVFTKPGEGGVENVVKDAAKTLGYDPDRISFVKGSRAFTVAGKEFQTAGLAYTTGTRKGDIEIYTDHAGVATAGGLTAHEVTHQKFQYVIDGYKQESAEIRRLEELSQRTLPGEAIDHKAGPLAIDGSLRSKYKGKFPHYEALRPFWGGTHVTEIMETDGVTDYSRAYWDDYKAGKATTMETAIHETLAEMARVEWEGPGTLERMISRRSGTLWGDLYNDVNRLWGRRGWGS